MIRLPPQGFFGYERFGYGYFGVASQPALFSAAIVSAGLVSALSQNPENAQQIGTSVLIDGVDYSSYVDYVLIQTKEDSISPTATISLIGSFQIQSTLPIIISATYSFKDGTSFSSVIFSGSVRSSQPTSGSQQQTTTVYGYDSASDTLLGAPNNSSWSGSALDLVMDELSYFSEIVSDFADYTLPAGLDLSVFQTKRDLILAVAGGREEVVLYVDQLGTAYVRNYASGIGSSQTIDTRGVTYYQVFENDADKYYSVTIATAAGISETVTSGVGKSTYSATSIFCVTAIDCAAKALEISERSQRAVYSMQTPLNPIAQIGRGMTLNNTDGTQLLTGKVIGISHSIQWTGKASPGAWTTFTVRAAA